MDYQTWTILYFLTGLISLASSFAYIDPSMHRALKENTPFYRDSLLLVLFWPFLALTGALSYCSILSWEGEEP